MPIFSFSSGDDKNYRNRLKHLLGFRPGKMHLYKTAFRHLSAAERIKFTNVKDSNERLEFLGDAVLDTIVAEIVFKKFPIRGEGFLTEVRSKIVSRKQLGDIAVNLGIPTFLESDQVLQQSRHILTSLSGNALEALVGAVYLDKGYAATKRFVYNKIIKPYIDLDEIENQHINYKSLLNQWAQKHRKNIEFRIVMERKQTKSGKFTIGLFVDGEEICQTSDFSKKNAEKEAAERACEMLGIEVN
ncbi:MAG: ribonuclease III [Bacteroidetes bacterium]|nr:ribonuclease III [Bacteroidota bacterium]